MKRPSRDALERLVKKAGAEALDNDPLRFPHRYKSREDKEVAALFSAVLAWGKRSIILNKLEDLFRRMGPSPYKFVRDYKAQRGDLGILTGFVHRTWTDKDIAGLTLSLRSVYPKYGSLEELFKEGLDKSSAQSGHERLKGALTHFVAHLKREAAKSGFPLAPNLLPDPAAGSACKRLLLFLRWMVRSGEHDLGLWRCIGPESLIVPLDLILGRAARCLGFTKRKSNDWRAAVEVTEALARYDARDPTRFDFALSQLRCPPDLERCPGCEPGRKELKRRGRKGL